MDEGDTIYQLTPTGLSPRYDRPSAKSQNEEEEPMFTYVPSRVFNLGWCRGRLSKREIAVELDHFLNELVDFEQPEGIILDDHLEEVHDLLRDSKNVRPGTNGGFVLQIGAADAIPLTVRPALIPPELVAGWEAFQRLDPDAPALSVAASRLARMDSAGA